MDYPTFTLSLFEISQWNAAKSSGLFFAFGGILFIWGYPVYLLITN